VFQLLLLLIIDSSQSLDASEKPVL